MEPVHFLLHIPKCAGTTVESHFARHLGPAFLLAPRWEHVARNFIGNRYPGIDMTGVRAVSGHSLSISLKRHIDAPVAQSVLLRDPLGYFLSFYNYRWSRHAGGDAKPPGFATWYATQRRNPISRFILNRYFEQGVPALYRFSSADRLAWLEERLTQFHFVGSYRHANKMIAGISRALDLPQEVTSQNITPSRKLSKDDLAPALLSRIAEENAVDQILYDRWADRLWSGAPDTTPPRMPRHDQLRYAAADTLGSIAKKILR